MKNIYLIRHAKSSWDNPRLEDFDRPLNERGEKDAPFMADLLKKEKIFPDAIVSSGANRAISTAILIAKKLEFPKDKIVINNSIYESSFNDILKIVKNFSVEYNNVFLIGHNPGLNIFSDYISDKIIDNIPTCGIVGIRFSDNWANITHKSGKMFKFDYPKKFKI